MLLSVRFCYVTVSLDDVITIPSRYTKADYGKLYDMLRSRYSTHFGPGDGPHRRITSATTLEETMRDRAKRRCSEAANNMVVACINVRVLRVSTSLLASTCVFVFSIRCIFLLPRRLSLTLFLVHSMAV